jgi:alkylation response protein AidB-like acyl-CoA dehydrogenase
MSNFGNQIVYGDPSWYQGWSSPYYRESHVRWRERCRLFVEEHILPNVSDWESQREIPRSLAQECARMGLLPCVAGSNAYRFIRSENIKAPDDYDYFHELIFIDELARCASGGVLWGLIEGLQIGLPPVLNFGTQKLKDLIAEDCLLGKSVICLCITEPTAGSDVSGIRTSAVRDDVNQCYIVNGEKKFITAGIFSDFFTVAVKTGDTSVSLLLLDKGMKGLKRRRMDCQGVWSSGTTFIELNDVRVPFDRLIGQEGNGLKMIYTNFNHERIGFVIQANRFARVCLEESIKYALKRKTFGKPLIEHEVIRWKIAEMTRQIESCHCWLESVVHQMNVMSPEEGAVVLAGPISLLKAHSTKIFEYCAREASQIFGGNSYSRSGIGEKIERLYRDVRAYAIPGGSEEILLDLGVRQAVKRTKSTQSRM